MSFNHFLFILTFQYFIHIFVHLHATNKCICIDETNILILQR